MVLTKEQYYEYYSKYQKCVDDISKPVKPLNQKRLQSKYEKYVSKEEKKKVRQVIKTKKVKDEWDSLRQQVLDRDGSECQFLKMIKLEFGKGIYQHILDQGHKLINQVDLAHIFPRSTYPQLKDDPDNCIMVNRYCHSLLDEMKSPITEERITVEQRLNFFLLLLPNDRLKRLEEKTGMKFEIE